MTGRLCTTRPHRTEARSAGRKGQDVVAPAVCRTFRWAASGGDPHRRRFDGHFRQLIMCRDIGVPEPVCEAPIRHIDHIQRYSDGGLTIYPNGRGACERGNYPREMSGWKVEVIGGGLDGQPHTIKITTPTGHTDPSSA